MNTYFIHSVCDTKLLQHLLLSGMRCSTWWRTIGPWWMTTFMSPGIASWWLMRPQGRRTRWSLTPTSSPPQESHKTAPTSCGFSGTILWWWVDDMEWGISVLVYWWLVLTSDLWYVERPDYFIHSTLDSNKDSWARNIVPNNKDIERVVIV